MSCAKGSRKCGWLSGDLYSRDGMEMAGSRCHPCRVFLTKWARPPLLFLALPASQAPAGRPGDCQSSPGCPSGFSSLGKNTSLHPVKAPTATLAPEMKGKPPPIKAAPLLVGTGSAFGNWLWRQACFLVSLVQGGITKPGSSSS